MLAFDRCLGSRIAAEAPATYNKDWKMLKTISRDLAIRRPLGSRAVRAARGGVNIVITRANLQRTHNRRPMIRPRRWGKGSVVSSNLTYNILSMFMEAEWRVCVDKLTSIGSDNGLSPERHQAIVPTNAGILLIGPLGTNLSDILIGIQTFSALENVVCKMTSILSRPQSVTAYNRKKSSG